jgi:multicomponent K+:H+ antiporter subunit D
VNAWQQHLVIVPVLLPLTAAALLLLVGEQRRALKRLIAFASLLVLLGAAVALMDGADRGPPAVYRVGDWPVPFGIVLVADRLSALMVLLATVLGLASLLFS